MLVGEVNGVMKGVPINLDVDLTFTFCQVEPLTVVVECMNP